MQAIQVVQVGSSSSSSLQMTEPRHRILTLENSKRKRCLQIIVMAIAEFDKLTLISIVLINLMTWIRLYCTMAAENWNHTLQMTNKYQQLKQFVIALSFSNITPENSQWAMRCSTSSSSCFIRLLGIYLSLHARLLEPSLVTMAQSLNTCDLLVTFLDTMYCAFLHNN